MAKLGKSSGMRVVAIAASVGIATALAAGPAAAKPPAETCLHRATADAWNGRPIVVGVEDGRTLSVGHWKYVKKPVEGLEYLSLADSATGEKARSFLAADSVRTLSYVHRRGDPVVAGFAGLVLGGLFGAALGSSTQPSDTWEQLDAAAIGLAIGAGVGLIGGLVLGRHRIETKSMDCGAGGAANPGATAESAP